MQSCRWDIDQSSFTNDTGEQEKIIEIANCIKLVYERIFSEDYVNDAAVLIANRNNTETAPSPYCLPISQESSYCVYVDYISRYYVQLIYQLSHEISHVMMKCHPINRKWQWLSEILCESASYIVLKEIRREWGENTLLKQMKFNDVDSYSQSVKKYLFESKTLLPNDVSTYPEYYERNEASFFSDPTLTVGSRRPRNNVLSWPIYKNLISVNLGGWTAIKYMKDVESHENNSTADFFENWLIYCQRNDQKLMVQGIRELILGY